MLSMRLALTLALALAPDLGCWRCGAGYGAVAGLGGMHRNNSIDTCNNC